MTVLERKPSYAMRSVVRVVLSAIVAVNLSACSQFEPYQRVGTWHENNAVDHNIAVELQTPTDLLYGRSSPVLTGAVSNGAISQVEHAFTSGNGGVSTSSSGAGLSGGGGMGGGGVGGGSSMGGGGAY